MATYKSLQLAEAFNRISQDLTPQVTVRKLSETAYAKNTLAPSATDNVLAQLETDNRQLSKLVQKSAGDYVQDGLVSLGKGVVGVPQAAVGVADIVDSGFQALFGQEVKGGRVADGLASAGMDFKSTQDYMNEWYSDEYKKQLQGLGEVPGMSTDKSFGDNLSSLGQTAAYVMDNPSLALNTIIESLPAIGAGGVVGKGAAKLGAKGVAGAAIGEGTVMSGTAQANMARNAEGHTTGAQALGSLAIGMLGGAVGAAGGRIASKSGARDIDVASTGATQSAANTGFKSLGVGTAVEAAEEAAQSSLENVISNISSGRDAIQGLNQDLVLGTLAGAGMGFGMNAKSSIATAALDAVKEAAEKTTTKIRERVIKDAPEHSDATTAELADSASDKYNPTAAIIREASKVTSDSTSEEITAAKASVDSVIQNAESHLAELHEVKATIESEAVWLDNLAKAESAVEQFVETDPERAQKAQNAIDQIIQPKLDTINKVKETTTIEQANEAIETATLNVNKARDTYSQFESLFNAVTASTEAEAPVEAQPIDKQIFGAPHNFTDDQIQQAIADPVVPEESKVVLRALSEAKVAQNAVKDIDAVNQQIVGKKLDANYRSTPQYLAQYSSAIKSGSITAQQNLMREITAFEQSHVGKTVAIKEAITIATTQGSKAQVVKTTDGWEVRTTDFVSTDKGSATNGAYTVNPTPRGIAAATKISEYMDAEATAITATKNVMEQLAVINTPVQTNAPNNQVPVSSDPLQDAMDAYNQDMRDNYVFQPERKTIDPRNNETRSSIAETPTAETGIQSEIQPEAGTVSGATNTEQSAAQTNEVSNAAAQSFPEPNVQDYVVEFDENGVGSSVPKQDAPLTTDQVDAKAEPVTSSSESVDEVTEVQSSTANTKEETATNEAVNAEPVPDVDDQTVAESSINKPSVEADAEEVSTELTTAREAERAKEPNKRNLVVDGFNKKPNVLNKNADFVSTFMNRENIDPVVKKVTNADMNDAQRDAVKAYVRFHNKISPMLEDIVGSKSNDYRHQDFNQYLLVDGQLPENTKTAITASIFTWLAENGNKTIHTEKDAAKLLLLDNIEHLPHSTYLELRGLGDHQNVVVNSLGQKAFSSLGLKLVNDVDKGRKSKLESGLGTLAAIVMTRSGLLKRTTLEPGVFSNMQDYVTTMSEDDTGFTKVKPKTANDYSKATTSFLVVSNEDGKPNTAAEYIVKVSKGTQGIVNKLFDVPTDNKLPSLKPIKQTPKKFNRIGSEVPDFAKLTYKVAQGNAYVMSENAMKFIDNVPEKDLKEIFGYVKQNKDGSFDGMHKKFWAGQEAANQALERSLDIITEHRTNLEDDTNPFYLENTIWTNQRSGYDSVFNLQANKVHRAVAGMKDHIVEVGVNEATHKNGETTAYGEFLMAVAMSAEGIADVIGLDTVDKISSETFLPKMQEYMNQEYVQDGIESMAAILEGVGKASDIANVKSLVSEFGMGPMSVRALQNLASHYIAERDGARTFTADIAFESDGVTNGPVITNVALNTADDEILAAGGVYKDANTTNVPTNTERGQKDIYKQLGGVMKTKWNDYKQALKPLPLKTAQALDTIYPAFGERKGAKPIVTTSNYGAGMSSISRANAREVIDAFYKGLEKAGKAKTEAEMNAQAGKLIDAVNQTIGSHNFFNKLNTPLAKPEGNVMEFVLTAAQEKALYDTAIFMHGSVIKDTLNDAMQSFQEARDQLTEHGNVGFELYNLIYKYAVESTLEDNIDGHIIDGNDTRQEGLSSVEEAEVFKELSKYMPVVKSGMANNSENGNKASIPLMKLETTQDDSAVSKQEHSINGSWTNAKDKAQRVGGSVRRTNIASPGVSGLALIIQSIDAFIAHSVIKDIASQNYHDANASAVGKGKAMARIQNEAFVDGLATTHVNREFVRAMLKPMQIVIDNPGFYDQNSVTINNIISDIAPDLLNRIDEAYKRDMAKLEDMLTWVNVNQYGTQGGHYVMTKTKKDKITKQLADLKRDAKTDSDLAKKILDGLKGVSLQIGRHSKVTVESVISKGTIMATELVPTLSSNLRDLKSSKDDVGFFAKFYDSVLDLVTKNMPKDLEINYYYANKMPSNVSGLEEALKQKNPAWYTKGKDGKPQINIIRTGESVKAAVLVHELVHAITVDAIANTRADGNPKAKDSLDKLDALYNHVKAQINSDPKASHLKQYAIQNLEEFVATGFSYPEFVNYLDSMLAPKAARGKNRIVSALRAFVDGILGVIESFTGRKYSAKTATALEALILDSTEFLGRSDTKPSAAQKSLFGAPQQARDVVDGYTSKEVFNALNSNIDSDFKAHLSDVMTQVSDTIYSSLDSSFMANPDGTWSAEQAWDEFIKAGNANTTETATTAGFRMSEQESFAVESLYAALTHGLKNKQMSQVHIEMEKIFNASRDKLNAESFFDGDWNTASKDEHKDAQDMYDFIFKYGKDNPEPLARFVSMAVGSYQFNKMLGFTTKDSTNKPTGTFEKLVEGINSVTEYLSGLMTNTSHVQNINSRITGLSKELARIDSKNRSKAVSKVESSIEKIEDLTDAASDAVRDAVVNIANHKNIAESRFTAVRLASNTTVLAAKGDLWTTLDVLKEWMTYDNSGKKLGFWGELVNEAANNDMTKDMVEKLLRLTKLNNQTKENIRDATTKNVMSTFVDNGSYLTVEDKSAITNMLRADVNYLLDSHSVKDIAKMFSNNSYLDNEISKVEKSLSDAVMATRAKQLAKYMVTGKPSPGLAKNARLIVSGFNTGTVADVSDARIDLVDKLASMYAIKYMSKSDKTRLNTVMVKELKNSNNGIESTLKFQQELFNTAKENLFKDNPLSMAKGYVPEITNPNKEVRIATNATESKMYKDQFYKEVKVLTKDKLDPVPGMNTLFVTEEANIQRIVSGVMEVVSTNRKGTQSLMTAKQVSDMSKLIAASNISDPEYNPMLDKDIYMVPNHNSLNEVTGYSYEMSGHNKNILLERNNDFSELLGAYAAANFNKVKVPDQNIKVSDALLEDYKENFSKNPRAYVTVGPNSDDVGLRESWALLPESTRQHILNTWGTDGMHIRNDILITVLGYRKYSVNHAFDKLDESKSMFEKVYTGVMGEIFGSNAKVRGVQVERAWQEAVSLMKDIIVIRNVKTLLMNTMSNTLLLKSHGVSVSDIIRNTTLSIRAGLRYRKDMAMLLAAQQKQRAGVGDYVKLEQEILRLQDSLKRNPLAEFIEEGMMPTIVEDVDPDTKHYTYKSALQKRIDDVTSNVPSSVKTAAKWAMVSPDTPLYKFLNNATQFSDFSAKYVMYKHYTEAAKGKDKLSHDEALQIASGNFINYDNPTSKGLQYLNDMGIVMFTKYNIRIQKALFSLMKRRPASVLSQALLVDTFTNVDTAIEPLIWMNIGNPLRDGVLGVPSALDEPLPIKMMTSVF